MIHERYPEIFQNRIEDVDKAIQLLKEGGSEKQVMDHYRKFSEAVKGLRLLQDQFAASTEQLSSTVAWLKDYSSKMKSTEDQGVFAKLWKTFSVFTPEIKDRVFNLAQQVEQDVKFYSSKNKEVQKVLGNLKERVGDVNQDFLKMLASLPQERAHGKSYIDQIRQLGTRYLHREEPLSLVEYIDIKRQLMPISFLLEECNSLKENGIEVDQRLYDRIAVAKKDSDSLLKALEEKYPEFRDSDLYAEQEKIALLEDQWKKKMKATHLTKQQRLNLKFIFEALKLGPKVRDDIKDFLGERAKIQKYYSEHKIEDKTNPSKSLGTQIQAFLDGTNTTAIDYEKYTPQQVLSALKQIEYENVQTRHPVSEEYLSRTYDLREECLLQSGGGMSSCLAFTYSSDPAMCESVDKLMNEKEWHPHRIELQRKIISLYFKQTMNLSIKLNNTIPTTYALRGNTSSGKTRIIKTDPFFRNALDSAVSSKGIINPDIVKFTLREGTPLINQQIHREGYIMSMRLIESLREGAAYSSVIIDKRLATKGDIDATLKFAEAINSQVNFIDIDAPLEDSCLGTLTRSPHGEDPTVPFNIICRRLSGDSKNRLALLDKAQNSPFCGNYKLFSKGELIAEMKEGSLKVAPGKENTYNQLIQPMSRGYSRRNPKSWTNGLVS